MSKLEIFKRYRATKEHFGTGKDYYLRVDDLTRSINEYNAQHPTKCIDITIDMFSNIVLIPAKT